MSQSITGAAIYADMDCLKSAAEQLNWRITIHDSSKSRNVSKSNTTATLTKSGVIGSVRVQADGTTVVDGDNFRGKNGCRAFQELTAHYAMNYAKKKLGNAATIKMIENEETGTIRIEAQMVGTGSGSSSSGYAL